MSDFTGQYSKKGVMVQRLELLGHGAKGREFESRFGDQAAGNISLSIQHYDESGND